MEAWIALIWCAAITVGVVVADVRITKLEKELREHHDKAHDPCDSAHMINRC